MVFLHCTELVAVNLRRLLEFTWIKITHLACNFISCSLPSQGEKFNVRYVSEIVTNYALPKIIQNSFNSILWITMDEEIHPISILNAAECICGCLL